MARRVSPAPWEVARCVSPAPWEVARCVSPAPMLFPHAGRTRDLLPACGTHAGPPSIPPNLRGVEDGAFHAGSREAPSVWRVGLQFHNAGEACADTAAHGLVEADFSRRRDGGDGFQHRIRAAGGDGGVGKFRKCFAQKVCDKAMMAERTIIRGDSQIASKSFVFVLQENVDFRTTAD